MRDLDLLIYKKEGTVELIANARRAALNPKGTATSDNYPRSIHEDIGHVTKYPTLL